MTSPQHAIARHLEARNTSRPSAEDALRRPRHDTMDHHVAAAIAQAASSEYGSDVSLTALSDYGSDIDFDDIQEDTALGSLPVKVTAYASIEIARPTTEGDAQDVGVATHPWRQPVVHWEERIIQRSPVVASGKSMEFEYDVPSRRAFSGTSQSPISPSRRDCHLTS